MKYQLTDSYIKTHENSEYAEIFKNPDFYIDTEWGSVEDTPFGIKFNLLSIPPEALFPVSGITKDPIYVMRNSLYKIDFSKPCEVRTYSNSLIFRAFDLTNGYSTSIATNTITYDPLIVPDDNGDIMTLPTTTQQQVLGNYGKEQIRGRYVFTDRPSSGLSNIIVDSFLPRLLYRHNLDMDNLLDKLTMPKTAYAISPFVANLLNVRQMPIEDIIAYYNYSVKDLKQLLTTVKRKGLTFVFAGVGGTGMNTLYWLNKMCDVTNIVNLFKQVVVYEKEEIEISNVLRFPMPLSDYYQNSHSSYKYILAKPYAEKLSTNRVVFEHRYLGKRALHWRDSGFQDKKAQKSTVVYGAPSLEYRNELSDIGHFICATHAANECSIWLNPRQDDELALETYGLIQLAPFFMNQVKLVLSTLELLASDQDLSEQDKHIMDFAFDGTPLKRPSRTYNWQIVNDPLVLTEQQANNI